MPATCFRKFVFLSIAFFVWPQFSSAQVSINEIMYDLSGTDTGREWIEVFNAGPNPIDLSSWKFFENNSNHTLNNIRGGASLSVGSYAIIADDSSKFLADWPAFSGVLFDSVFSLNNTGETISMRDANSLVIDEVGYDSSLGAVGDGNTLNRSGNSWVPASPTPGAANSLITAVSTSTATTTDQTSTTTPSTTATNQSQTSNTQSTSVVISTHYTAMPLTTQKTETKFEIGAGRSRLGTVGTPMEFKAESNKEYTKKTIYKWSFGDGASIEGETVVHAYQYPGEYVLVLNAESPEGKAVSRTNVKIVPPELFITFASPERVEVSNNSTHEINLYGRALVSSSQIFVFPEDTIIPAKQKISFSSFVTGLTSADNFNIGLLIVGTQAVPEKIAIKLEEDRLDKIAQINAEIISIQSALSRISQQEPKQRQIVNIPVEEAGESKIVQVAAVNQGLSATTTNSFKGWLATLKQFFLGR